MKTRAYPLSSVTSGAPQLRGPIVLATDGSSDAAVARRAAADLARGLRVPVHVVTAWPATIAVMPYGGYIVPEDAGVDIDSSARRLVAHEATRLEEAGATVAGRHVVTRRPAEAIHEVADAVDAGLIVLGCQGLGPMRRLVMGSVSEEVVHHSHRPVLVVRGGPAAWPPARVVVGDDGSEIAALAVLEAAAIAAALRIPVIVTMVIPHIADSYLAAPGMSIEAALASARIHVEDRIAELSGRAGVEMDVWIGVGDPAVGILDEAQGEPQPCLVAVGSRGAGLVTRMRHGSVSRKVLHLSHAPVLVVPPPSAEHG